MCLFEDETLVQLNKVIKHSLQFSLAELFSVDG